MAEYKLKQKQQAYSYTNETKSTNATANKENQLQSRSSVIHEQKKPAVQQSKSTVNVNKGVPKDVFY